MVTPVDESQIQRHSTSDQVTNDNNKASSFELISLAKLSTKILFTLLVLVLATLTFLIYLNDQETQKKLIASVDTTVSERGGALDAEIYSIVGYIKRIKSITDRHLLRLPDTELVQTSIKRIEKAAVYHKKGDHSHLEKGTTIGSNEVLGSIIVSGKFNDQLWSRLKWILLGLDLFDSQEAEHGNSENITLSYFISKKYRFISTYPAIDVEEILSEQEGNAAKWLNHAFEVYEEFISRNNNPKREVFWTQPYLDRAGNGMMVSCAIPVDEPSGVVGVLGADIILNFINRFTVPIATLPGEMILVSPNREVISASGLSYDTENDIVLLDAFLKSKNDELMDFTKQPKISNRQDEILFTYTLKNAPWTLLYLVPKASLNATMFAARVRGGLILLMVMLIFGGGYSYLSKRFIQPGIKAITERNTAEQALRKSEERLELAMTVANDGIWDWHLENDNVFFDSRYYTMAGYVPNEFPSQLEQWQQRIHPDDLQKVLSATKQHFAGERDAYAEEFRFRRKQGGYMWILARGKIVSRDAEGKPLRFVGTHSDITQRKRAEEQLRILMRAVEQSHSTIVITDLDANIEFANPAFTRVTGYTLEEAVHQNPRILKSDEHDFAFYKSMWDTLSRGDVWQGEMR
ncbi:MAG: PAS domain-containing protein, partial [Deltaproteobacteria bacterium]|nr:PAS domain-containing protein [Deltaproteobacteria bacterium]